MSHKQLTNRIFSQLVCAALCSGLFFSQVRAQQSNDQDASGAVPPPTGVDTSTQLSENPPLTGLDSPSFEPSYGARSYLSPKVQVSEAVDTNGRADIGNSTPIKESTRALGSLALQKLWRRHPLSAVYVGGVDVYNGRGGQIYQIHSASVTQRLLWRTGQLALRDTFTYFPEGTFGFNSFGGSSAFGGGGGVGSLGGGVPGGSSGFGGGGVFESGQFGSIGLHPRITNMSIADITQYLSPRSSIVLAGGYGWTDFLNNPQGFINSNQATAQAGYNYQITRHDQIAVSYAFQEIHFPNSGRGSFNVNLWHVTYGHRISGKLDFKIGGGPQWVHSHQVIDFLGFLIPLNNTSLTASGQVVLNYRMSARTSMSLTYRRFINPGSGFFAGANTDSVRLGLNHALARKWNVLADGGYSYSSRLLSGSSSTANNATHYGYWYVGGAIRRQLGRQFGAFASYQYNALGFGQGFCSASCGPGSRSYSRHVGLIGIDWTPRPIRLD